MSTAASSSSPSHSSFSAASSSNSVQAHALPAGDSSVLSEVLDGTSSRQGDGLASIGRGFSFQGLRLLELSQASVSPRSEFSISSQSCGSSSSSSSSSMGPAEPSPSESKRSEGVRRLSGSQLPAVPEDFDPEGFDEHLDVSLSRSDSQNSGLSLELTETRDEFLKRRNDIHEWLKSARTMVEAHCHSQEPDKIADPRVLSAFYANLSKASLLVGDLLHESRNCPGVYKEVRQLQESLKTKVWDADPKRRKPEHRADRRGALVPGQSGSVTPKSAGSAKPSPQASPKVVSRPATPLTPISLWDRIRGHGHEESPQGKAAVGSSGKSGKSSAAQSPRGASRELSRDLSFVDSFRRKDDEYRAFMIFAEEAHVNENPDFLETVEAFENARDEDKPGFGLEIMEKSRANAFEESAARQASLIGHSLKEQLPDVPTQLVVGYAIEPPKQRDSEFGFSFGMPGDNKKLPPANVSHIQQGKLFYAHQEGPTSSAFKGAVEIARDEIFRLVESDVWQRYLAAPNRADLLAQVKKQPGP